MRPIRTNESNFTYLGPNQGIADLPCHKNGGDTFSVWELTDEERKAIAEGGHIRLGIHGMEPIPPVSLQVVHNSGSYQRKDAPCDLCGKEVEDPAHDSGPGTHTYRCCNVTEASKAVQPYQPQTFG